MSGAADRLGFAEVLHGFLNFVARRPPLHRALPILARKDPGARLSVGRFVERAARRWPARTAIRFDDLSVTYADFNARANRWAHALAARGVKRGEVVAVAMESRPEALVAATALAKLGATAAMLSAELRGASLAHCLAASGPSAFVAGEEALGGLVAGGGDWIEGARGRRFFVADRGERPAPEGWEDLDALAKSASSANPASSAEVTAGEAAFHVFTSGTTGLPKASIMTHLRWVRSLAGLGMMVLHLGPSDTLYVPVPLHHNVALTLAWPAALAGGAALALRRRFSARAFWDDCRRLDATAFAYVGELCRYLLARPPASGDRDHRVRTAAGVGLRPELWGAMRARFGVERVYELYGSSEAPAGFLNLFNLEGTVGFCPLAYALVEYDPETGAPRRGPDGRVRRVARGRPGLLLQRVSARFGFDGYTDPEATESKLVRDAFHRGDAWFNSGDLLRDVGFRHARFVDRLGDTFRWKGENVATTEVERVLGGFPGVEDCCVYGVEVPGAEGRAGMAAVVTRLPLKDFDLLGLAARFSGALPAYAVPRFLRFTRDLETTGTFKHRKGPLRAAGFDPARVGEPLFVLAEGGASYEPLGPETLARIRAGTWRG